MRRDIDRVPPEKLVYIPNGTVVPALIQRPAAGPIVIGTVGRLVEAKDYLTLMRAVHTMRAAGRIVTLYILGDGPERPILERAREELGLQSIVMLPGFQSDISAWMARFHLFVLSSIQEGQPMALLEAMAHGLPIVATRVGGIPDTIVDGVEGILVESKNAQELAAAIQQLLDDPDRGRMLGNNARKRVIQEYSIQAVCQRYIEIYRMGWQLPKAFPSQKPLVKVVAERLRRWVR
jgi:glycosyltransferase involved in cell wall biosynthesis